MKCFVIFSALILAIYALPIEEKWSSFKITYKKHYTDSKEEGKRLKTFSKNLKKIEAHNKLYEQTLSSYKKGVNQFSDLTQEELKRFFLKPSVQTNQEKGFYVKPKNGEFKKVETQFTLDKITYGLPDNFDWRDEGAVGPVKDQKTCSSWAFAATACVETQFYRKTNESRQLSDQQLIDCVAANEGCGEGNPRRGLEYVGKNGLSKEEEYPFTGEAGTCRENTTNNAEVFDIFFYTQLLNYEEMIAWQLVHNGPLTAYINGNYLPTYESGIIDDAGCTADVLNHDVLVVGYGIENGKEFWTVKNFWGENWGEKGYARIAKNNNTCGIATFLNGVI